MRADGQRKLHIACGLFFAAVFAVIFVLSLLTPMIADDYNYAFGFANDTRIRSLHDICESMSWHRKLLNGRVFSHGWLSLVLMFPRWVFAALNAAVAVLFSWTTTRFFHEHGSRRPVWAALCVWMLLWICMPGFGQVYFWTAGACNYFWSFTFSWFIIWRADRLGQTETCRERTVRTALLLLPAFAAGAWSEHISFAMLMILFLLLIWEWRKKRRFPLPNALVLASGCAGYLFLMLAPATKLLQRLQWAGDPETEGNLAIIMGRIPGRLLVATLAGGVLLAVIFLILRHRRSTRSAMVVLTSSAAAVCGIATVASAISACRAEGIYGLVFSSVPGFLLLLCVFCAALSVALREEENKDRVIMALILSFSGMCAMALFLFGEYFPIRGFCAPVSLLVLAAVYLADPVEPKREKTVQRTLDGLLVLCFVFCFWMGVQDILLVHHEAVSREDIFEKAAAGDKIVVVSPYVYHTKYTAQYGNPDLSYDAGWPNGIMADYYDVVRIIVIEE